MAAYQAQPQMNPGIAHLDALFTDTLAGSGNLDLLHVLTLRWHAVSLSGRFRRSFQSLAVPFAQVCARFISALQELKKSLQ